MILNPNYEIFHLWSYVSFFHIRLLRWECRVATLWLKRCSGYTDLASLELQGSRVSWTTTHQDCKAECFTSSHQRRHQKHYHIATSAQPVMSMWTWEQRNKSHGYLAVRPEQVMGANQRTTCVLFLFGVHELGSSEVEWSKHVNPDPHTHTHTRALKDRSCCASSMQFCF